MQHHGAPARNDAMPCLVEGLVVMQCLDGWERAICVQRTPCQGRDGGCHAMECQVNANVAVDGMQWNQDATRRRGARVAELWRWDAMLCGWDAFSESMQRAAVECNGLNTTLQRMEPTQDPRKSLLCVGSEGIQAWPCCAQGGCSAYVHAKGTAPTTCFFHPQVCASCARWTLLLAHGHLRLRFTAWPSFQPSTRFPRRCSAAFAAHPGTSLL